MTFLIKFYHIGHLSCAIGRRWDWSFCTLFHSSVQRLFWRFKLYTEEDPHLGSKRL